MNVGIVCYASVGGSGIVATELAKVLARRGHEVRLISSEPPFRLVDFQAGLAFHAVQTPGYPLFREPQYLLSLANKIVEVSREFDLDIIHAHMPSVHLRTEPKPCQPSTKSLDQEVRTSPQPKHMWPRTAPSTFMQVLQKSSLSLETAIPTGLLLISSRKPSTIPKHGPF